MNDMNPIERRMWLELERSVLIPRSIKEAFAFEWARDRPGRACLILLAYQMAFTAALFAVSIAVGNALS